MIPKNKIEEATKEFASKGVWECPVSFKEGVSFAEKELENLAIEFAEWLSWGCWRKILVENSNDWGHITGNTKTTQELFEIFKQEKYEHEH